MTNEPKIKITSDGTWATSHIMIGDQEIRASKLELDFSPNSCVKATIEVYVDLVDIDVLEHRTEVIIKKEP